MSYKLRKLKTTDFFTMSRILSKLNLDIETTGKTQEQFGFELFKKVAENLHLAEEEVTEFLAKLCGISVEAFEDLGVAEIMDIYEQFKGLDGVQDFLSKVRG